MHACGLLLLSALALWPVLSLNRGYTARRSIPKRAAGGTVNPAGGYVLLHADYAYRYLILLLYLLIGKGACALFVF